MDGLIHLKISLVNPDSNGAVGYEYLNLGLSMTCQLLLISLNQFPVCINEATEVTPDYVTIVADSRHSMSSGHFKKSAFFSL